MSLSPSSLITGTLSPVNMDSSIVVEPDLTTPSVGTFSPGLMISMSFLCRSDNGITRSGSELEDLPSKVPTNVADSGARSANADTALLVRFFARASKYFPSSTNVIRRLELSNDCMRTGQSQAQNLFIAL